MTELSAEALAELRKPSIEVTVIVDNHTYQSEQTEFGQLLKVTKPQADVMVEMGVVRMGKLSPQELEQLRESNPQAAAAADRMLARATVKPAADESTEE